MATGPATYEPSDAAIMAVPKATQAMPKGSRNSMVAIMAAELRAAYAIDVPRFLAERPPLTAEQVSGLLGLIEGLDESAVLSELTPASRALVDGARLEMVGWLLARSGAAAREAAAAPPTQGDLLDGGAR